MEQKKYELFANGTECMVWQDKNCYKCIKAVFYNEKRGTFPSYRCAIQREIELASVTDGCGTQLAYEATKRSICPYLQTERKPKKQAEDNNQLNLF